MDKSRELQQQITDLEALLASPGWKLLSHILKESSAYYLAELLKCDEFAISQKLKGSYAAFENVLELPENVIKQFRSDLFKELNNKADQEEPDNLQE